MHNNSSWCVSLSLVMLLYLGMNDLEKSNPRTDFSFVRSFSCSSSSADNVNYIAYCYIIKHFWMHIDCIIRLYLLSLSFLMYFSPHTSIYLVLLWALLIYLQYILYEYFSFLYIHIAYCIFLKYFV